MRSLSATEFKAKCLALLDEVANNRESVVITKRGVPVAQLNALPPSETDIAMVGTVHIVGDIMEPVVEPEEWHALRPAR